MTREDDEAPVGDCQPATRRPSEATGIGADDPRSTADGPAHARPVSTPRRRTFLALVGAGVAGLAGCQAAPGTESTTAGPNPGSPTATPADGTAPDGTPPTAGSPRSPGQSPTPTDGTEPPSGPTPTPGQVVGRPLEEWPGYDPDWAAPSTSPLAASLDTEVLVENLEIPWDLEFAPDGSIFITERVGRVLQFDGDDVRTVATPAGAIDAGSIPPGSDERPWWVKGGEGGTLGIAVHPTFPDPSYVYVYYTTTRGDQRTNRVDAFDVTSPQPGIADHAVVEGIPANNYHNGGRITFGPRNYLWVTTGDGGEPAKAQDPGALNGKILRVTPEGDPAPGNPDLGSGADPRVFTYGHRNSQGLIWLPDGTPVNSEHGPSGRDEINRLVPGDNYSWPEVHERESYPGTDYHKPLFNTGATSFAPTGSVFYTADGVPALQNRMVTGGLISQQLIVTTLTRPDGSLPPADDAYAQITTEEWSDQAYAATVHTMFEDELGRIRHVEQGPEGDIYACTSNRDGRAKGKFPREIDDVLVRITQG